VTFVGDDAQILDGCAGLLTDTQCATDGNSHAGAIRQREIGESAPARAQLERLQAIVLNFGIDALAVHNAMELF
jgi:hypothetical protein